MKILKLLKHLKPLGAIAIATASTILVIVPKPSIAGTLYNGWNYTFDPGFDSLAGTGNGIVTPGPTIYEIFGMAIKDDIDTDSIWIALNANLPLTGNPTATVIDGLPVPDGNIGWGDIFFDFSGIGNFQAASNTNSLYGIRFAETNDSGAPSVGVYSNVSGFWNGGQNAGYWSLATHNARLEQLSGNSAVTGDLAWNDPYYNLNTASPRTPNSIANTPSLTRIGDIEFVSNLQLIEQGFDRNFFPELGSQMIGFKFDKSLFPYGNFIATLLLECINDAIAAVGNLAPPPPVPEPPNPLLCDITPGQLEPLQPDFVEGKTKYFQNRVSGEWYDPPASMGFDFQVEQPSLFTSILGFPCGIDEDESFTVSVGGINLGEFRPGETLVFRDFEAILQDFLIDGEGVSQFEIGDIEIPEDGKDPSEFFVKLGFNTPTASFTMRQVPEPNVGLALLSLALTGVGIRSAKRRKSK